MVGWETRELFALNRDGPVRVDEEGLYHGCAEKQWRYRFGQGELFDILGYGKWGEWTHMKPAKFAKWYKDRGIKIVIFDYETRIKTEE